MQNRLSLIATLLIALTFGGGFVIAQTSSGFDGGSAFSLCGPSPYKHWMTVGYANFQSDGFAVPALVVESPAGTPRAQVGLLDDPATTVLLGNEEIGDESMSGISIDSGHWLDPGRTVAVRGSLMAMGTRSAYGYPANNNTIVSRPFFNVAPSVDGFDAELVNYPGIVDGTIDVMANTEFATGNLGLQKNIECFTRQAANFSRRIDARLGYRTFRLEDDLTITEHLTSTDTSGLVQVGTTFDVTDQFSTRSVFHGVELGFLGQVQSDRWTIAAAVDVAVGNVNQEVTTSGTTTITTPAGMAATQPFGILAVDSNSGSSDTNRFGLLSRASLDLGYQLTQRTQLKVGYNVLQLNSVARAGDHIDTVVNGTQFDPNTPLSGPSRPSTRSVDRSLLLHGLQIGIDCRF